MTTLAHPVLQAVADEARQATGARTALVVVVRPEGLEVAATSGPSVAAVGDDVPARGARGYVLAAGQPTSLDPHAADASNRGVGGGEGVPAHLLVVPGHGAVLVELADGPDRAEGPFTVAHMDAVGPLATIAEAAAAADSPTEEVAAPARLGAELAALAATEPGRYRDVARAVEALLSLTR